MKKTTTNRAYTVITLFLAFLMFASVFFSLIPNQTVPPDQEAPTPAPPTLPPPLTDFSGISLDERYLHPSGVYTIAQPTGWTNPQPSNNGVQLRTRFNNPTILSDIEVYIEQASIPVTDLNNLSGRFDQATLAQTWSGFTEWRETGRELDTTNNRVILDFEATRARQTLVARQVAWTDGQWIYSLRVLVPSNNVAVLRFLIEQLPATFTPIEVFKGTPLGWTSFYNPVDGDIIRYPQGWTVTDGRPGVPVSIRGINGETLQLETIPATNIVDEAAAQSFLQGLDPRNTVSNVRPITRNGVNGFSVAYTTTGFDGEGISGLAVLLNGNDGRLHLANIRVPIANLDLNNPTAETPLVAIDASQVLGSFTLTDGLNLPVPMPEIVETPEVTPAVTAEATPEATLDITAEATPEAASTEETTPEVTPEG
ncbi:MAG: hypothetical protein MUF87_18985 [Anaerolineae bacterium]|jgi:hypothetical protein|nr:hypothetical protein [Anaerolineae bacterium]